VEIAAPAINHADGIARVMGDAALFARVLARFRQEYRPAGERIRKALAAGDLPLAQRLAHTLKGAAGMIEAVPLREAAQALELALRHGDGGLEMHLARLEHALERVMRELDAAQAASPVQPPAPDAGPARTHADALRRLRTLLADGDGDAVDLVQEAAASLTGELGEERYRSVAAAIGVFDFEGALALLNRPG
jgi:HPt (histidine-containing phosphotransfer) domain-containing protein